MPSRECRLQNAARLVPWKLKLGIVVQERFEQRSDTLFTFTIPSSACCLQNSALLLSLKLKEAKSVQPTYEQGFIVGQEYRTRSENSGTARMGSYR